MATELIDKNWVGYGSDGGFVMVEEIPSTWAVVEIPIERSRASSGDLGAIRPGEVVWKFRGSIGSSVGVIYTHKLLGFLDPHLAFAFKLRWV